MARKIIVTRWLVGGGGGDLEVSAAYWLDVPVARRPFQARAVGGHTFESVVPDATADELVALRTGAVKEVVVSYSRVGSPTTAQAQTFLQGELARLQAETTNINEWRFAGSSYDGTSWTVVTVA